MIQPQSEAQILELVRMIGMAPGAKKMMQWEFEHAQKAIETGLYITWISFDANDDCFRVGDNSMCFCGCLFKDHDCTMLKSGKIKNNCKKCDCKEFRFIPRRPEEIGQHWLPRRKGFNINQWGASCICKHTHKEHKANKPTKCTKCACFCFTSDFACLSCDKKYEDHMTLYETEKERK